MLFGEVQSVRYLQHAELLKLQKDIIKKPTFFTLQQRKKLIFYHSTKEILHLRLPPST